MITRADAIVARHGMELHEEPCYRTIGERGGIKTSTHVWRVSGMPKTWKRDPKRFEVPIKFGLYKSATLSESNGEYLHWASDCPLEADTLDEIVGQSYEQRRKQRSCMRCDTSGDAAQLARYTMDRTKVTLCAGCVVTLRQYKIVDAIVPIDTSDCNCAVCEEGI